MKRSSGWALLLAANVLGYCVLSFYQTTAAAPATGQPFPNSTELRVEMIEQLKQITELLQEQNTLLRSGDVKVIVTELPKAAAAAQAEPAEK
jgi:hypothetical protein